MNLEKRHFNFSSEELTNFLKVAGVICVGVLTLFLLVKTINEVKSYSTIGTEVGPNGMQNTIAVQGKAEMFVKPDITTFTWTANGTGSTVVAAQNSAAEKGNKAIALLKEKGIKEADIKVIGYDTNPNYSRKTVACPVSAVNRTSADIAVSDIAVSMPAIAPCSNSSSVITSYTTNQTVEVKIRNIDDQPNLTGELVAALGVIGVTVSSPYSTIDNPDMHQQKVREEAIIKARREAEVLARALGVKLVKVISFNENNNYPYPYAVGSASRDMVQSTKAVTPDMPTGTNRLSSEVTVTYQIR